MKHTVTPRRMMKQAVTPRQMEILAKLREMARGEASYSELAIMMNVSQQAISTMADRLVRAGMAKRVLRSEQRLKIVSGKERTLA